MENEEVITVHNEGNKGNPNHKPAGSPEGGQFTSGNEVGGLKSKFLDFVKAKKESVNFFSDVTNNFASNCTLNKEHMKSCFETGTNEAKEMVGKFFKNTYTRIRNVEKNQVAHYSSFWSSIYFQPMDLKAQGKQGGIYELGEVFYHEIFHGMDHKYGELTTQVKLSNGKTMKEVFHGEISEKKYAWNWNLFNEVKAEFEKAINEEMSKMFSDEQIKEYNEKAEYYKKAMSDLNKNFDNHLYNYPSIQAYNEAYKEYVNKFKELKKQWKEVNDVFLPAKQKATHKYSCLSDFCSFVYRTGIGNKSICGGHPKKYWSTDGGNRAVKEMWAELGSMWARGKKDDLDRMRKYFPDTVGAFEELVEKIRKEK